MICNIKNISEIFYYFLGGISLLIGSIMAIISGTKYTSRVQNQKMKPILEIKRKYPVENIGTTFKLIRSKVNRRPVYLLDIKDKTIRWISSPSVLRALGYSFTMVEEIEQEEFKKYKEIEIIDFFPNP